MIRLALQSDVPLQHGEQTGRKVELHVGRLASDLTVEVGDSEDSARTHASLERSQSSVCGLDRRADFLQMETLVLRTSLE